MFKLQTPPLDKQPQFSEMQQEVSKVQGDKEIPMNLTKPNSKVRDWKSLGKEVSKVETEWHKTKN